MKFSKTTAKPNENTILGGGSTGEFHPQNTRDVPNVTTKSPVTVTVADILTDKEKTVTTEITDNLPTKDKVENSDESASSYEKNHVSHHMQSQSNEAEQRILLYSGITGGLLFAGLFILAMVYIQRKRRDRSKKERFSSTDQKTYQDTKIFVMANSVKTDNIVHSFDAIPPDTNLWKELQSTTPNVF